MFFIKLGVNFTLASDKEIGSLYSLLIIYLLILKREKKGEREKHWFVVPFIPSLIDSCMCPDQTDSEPTTLAYPDGALTNWVNPARAHSTDI